MNDERKSHMSSIIGETAVVIGNISGQGDLEIRGKIQGSIELLGRVFVAEGGIVLGNIEAGTITVSGEVRGDLSAGDGIVIQASGEVEGNLLAPRVGVEPGARVRGMLRTGATASAQDGATKNAPAPKKSFPEPQAPPFKADPAPVEDRRAPALKVEAALTELMLPAALPIAPPMPAQLTTVSTAAAATLAAAPLDRPDKARKRRRPRKPGQSSSSPIPDAINKAETATPRSAPPSVVKAAPPAALPQAPGASAPAKSRQKGPPKPPTFMKGAKGHQRG